MIMFILIGLICLGGIFPSNAIHHHMTESERLLTFHTAEIENVPSYEVVPVKITKRAAGTQVTLKAFGKDIKLYLNPTEGILAGYETPIYKISSGSPKPKWVRLVKVYEQMSAQMQEDSKKFASVVFTESETDNRANLRGVILDDAIAIHPIPDRLQNGIEKYSVTEVDDLAEHEANHTTDSTLEPDVQYHIITKIPEFTKNSSEFKTAFDRPESHRDKRAVPSVIYPQILVVIDNDYFKKLGSNIIGMMPYLLSFWNGVDLMYRTIENPKIRLNIAAFVYADDSRVLSYMANNMYSATELNVNKALDGEGEFWYNNQNPLSTSSYDVVVTMTTHTLCDRNGNQNTCAIVGLATVGATCTVYKQLKTLGGKMIVHDNGVFSNVETATHELGHALGAHHDDRSECSGEKGRIMWPSSSSGKDASDWSHCSANDFTKFLSNNPDCLYNKPSPGRPLPRYLPGRQMDANQQCQKLYGHDARTIDATICESLTCITKIEKTDRGTRTSFMTGGYAAEGTPCGGGKICLHNRCINANL